MLRDPLRLLYWLQGEPAFEVHADRIHSSRTSFAM